MNKTLGVQLAGYSVLLIGLSYFAYAFLQDLGKPTFITGCIGGALCLVWAAMAVVAGKRSKVLPILTLIAVSYVLLGHVILVWTDAPDRVIGAVLVTAAFVMSVGMIMRIAYAGMFGDASRNEPAAARKEERAPERPGAAVRSAEPA